MFYSITGRVVLIQPSVAVIDVGGVAFKCNASMNTLKGISVGETALLYTHLNVREDALDLFGFASEGELSCFKSLVGISGVGPKVALSILSELSPEGVAMAAISSDAKSFTRANGVGPKLAQRIVLELKDKVGKTMAGNEPPVGAQVSASSAAIQAVNALVALGYGASEAGAAVARQDSQLSVEELIRQALRSFSQ